MNKIKIVDAHHHFWNPKENYHPWLCDEPMIPFRYGDYSSIRKPFMPDDYFQVTKNHRIVKTVTMEGEWDPTDPVGESRWMQSVSEKYGFPHAHVAQAWMDADDVESVLKAQAAIPIVKSVRHKPRSAQSADSVVRGAKGSMADPAWREGYGMLESLGLHFDLQTPWWHLLEAAELAADYPNTLMILNHTGLPSDRSTSGLEGWRSAMKNLAQLANVVVKISGLGLPNKRWQCADNVPIIRETIEIFGIERCMFASNFPVDSVIGDFDTIVEGCMQAIADYSAPDQNKFFHDNAIRIYQL